MADERRANYSPLAGEQNRLLNLREEQQRQQREIEMERERREHPTTRCRTNIFGEWECKQD
jgi:hypothetical protein